jgi:hypothetical protein
MALGSPIFAGDSEIDTIFKIFRLLGTPSKECWPDIESSAYFFGTVGAICGRSIFPRWPQRSWNSELPLALEKLGMHGVDMVADFLAFDPLKRLSAPNAVDHICFAGAGRQLLRLQTPEPTSSLPKPPAETPEKLKVAISHTPCFGSCEAADVSSEIVSSGTAAKREMSPGHSNELHLRDDDGALPGKIQRCGAATTARGIDLVKQGWPTCSRG